MSPMLDDLDTLSARLSVLVQQVSATQQERAALQARVRQLEQERDAAREELQRRESALSSFDQQQQQHAAELDAVRNEASVANGVLQTEVAALRQQLHRLQAERDAGQERAGRLEAAARHARDRVEAVLARLPGAGQEAV